MEGSRRVKFLVVPKFASSFKWLLLRYSRFFHSYEIETSDVIGFALSSV